MITRLGGKKVFPIGIGTWRMGGGALGFGRWNDGKEIRALRFAIESGINVIDTAEIYAFGRAEQLVARAIEGCDREKLYIVTKVFATNFSPNKIASSARASLRRLGSKYIDLYLVHWPPSTAKMGIVMRAMEKLVDDGITNSIGISNFGMNQVRAALSETKRHDIVANQVSYSLSKKDAEDGLVQFCKKNKISIIAHTPLSKGKSPQIPEVREMASKLGKTPVQVALNYLTRNALPIPKSSNREHIREIIGSTGWNLGASDYARLKRL